MNCETFTTNNKRTHMSTPTTEQAKNLTTFLISSNKYTTEEIRLMVTKQFPEAQTTVDTTIINHFEPLLIQFKIEQEMKQLSNDRQVNVVPLIEEKSLSTAFAEKMNFTERFESGTVRLRLMYYMELGLEDTVFIPLISKELDRTELAVKEELANLKDHAVYQQWNAKQALYKYYSSVQVDKIVSAKAKTTESKKNYEISEKAVIKFNLGDLAGDYNNVVGKEICFSRQARGYIVLSKGKLNDMILNQFVLHESDQKRLMKKIGETEWNRMPRYIKGVVTSVSLHPAAYRFKFKKSTSMIACHVKFSSTVTSA